MFFSNLVYKLCLLLWGVEKNYFGSQCPFSFMPSFSLSSEEPSLPFSVAPLPVSPLMLCSFKSWFSFCPEHFCFDSFTGVFFFLPHDDMGDLQDSVLTLLLQCWGSYCALPIMDSAPPAIEQEHETQMGASRGLHWDLKEDSASFLVTKKTRALMFGQPSCQSGRNMTWENKSLIWAAEMQMEESQKGCTLWMYIVSETQCSGTNKLPLCSIGSGFLYLATGNLFFKDTYRELNQQHPSLL